MAIEELFSQLSLCIGSEFMSEILHPKINNRKIGKVNRLHNRIEALVWALGIVLAHILQKVSQPNGLASLNHGTGTVQYGRGQLGSIWWKKRCPQPFSSLSVISLCLHSLPLFLHVWIQIYNGNTDPDPQWSWIRSGSTTLVNSHLPDRPPLPGCSWSRRAGCCWEWSQSPSGRSSGEPCHQTGFYKQITLINWGTGI